MHIPPGRWFDVTRSRVVVGPTTLPQYSAGPGETPVFVRLSRPDTGALMQAVAHWTQHNTDHRRSAVTSSAAHTKLSGRAVAAFAVLALTAPLVGAVPGGAAGAATTTTPACCRSRSRSRQRPARRSR